MARLKRRLRLTGGLALGRGGYGLMTITLGFAISVALFGAGWALHGYNASWKAEQDRIIGHRGNMIAWIDSPESAIQSTFGRDYVDTYYDRYLAPRREPDIVMALKKNHKDALSGHSFDDFTSVIAYLDYLGRDKVAMEVAIGAIVGGYFAKDFSCNLDTSCDPIDNWRAEAKLAEEISETVFNYVIPNLIDGSLRGEIIKQRSGELLDAMPALDFVFGYSTEVQIRHSINLMVLALLDSPSQGDYSERYLTDLRRFWNYGASQRLQPEEFLTESMRKYAMAIDYYYGGCHLSAVRSLNEFRGLASHPLLVEMSYLMETRVIATPFRGEPLQSMEQNSDGTFRIYDNCVGSVEAKEMIDAATTSYCEVEAFWLRNPRYPAFHDDFDYLHGVLELWIERYMPSGDAAFPVDCDPF